MKAAKGDPPLALKQLEHQRIVTETQDTHRKAQHALAATQEKQLRDLLDKQTSARFVRPALFRWWLLGAHFRLNLAPQRRARR